MEIRIDRESGVALARQIADGVRAALRRGEIGPGSRLPAERTLARRLGVDRMTVSRAYEDLVAAGLVSRHVGRGSFVTVGSTDTEPVAHREGFIWAGAFADRTAPPPPASITALHAAAPEGAVNLSNHFPDPALFPLVDFRRALDAAIRREGKRLFGYGPAGGYPPLRRQLAESLRAQGAPVDEEGIIVTNGSQQGIDLVARALLDPGDRVVVENPTYTGAVQVFQARGARVIGVPVDGEGIRPDRLAETLERAGARLLYLIPNFQNPTSGTLSLPRRKAILEIAARHRVPILEDDFGGDLRYEGASPPSLCALDGSGGVVYLSSFAKKFLPGLRLGFLAAPREVAERLGALKQITDWNTNLLLQAALTEFCRRGLLERHLRRVRGIYRERRDAMVAAMERAFPKDARWTRPEGGLVVWVTLPPGVDADEVAAEARGRGVLVGRGDLFYVDGGTNNNLRLVFAQAGPDAIERGIRALGAILHRKLRERRSAAVTGEPEPIPII